LDGVIIWSTAWDIFDLRNKIVLSKDSHLEYPAVQILKYISQYGIKELFVIPGMANYIIE